MIGRHVSKMPNASELEGCDYYVKQIEEMGLPPLLAVARVANLLDIDRRRIYELVESGDLHAVRCGSQRLRIFRESLIDWLRRGGCR